jgi:GT2 family glycosyltransferase/polysaccharide pyruvyl transferase WcaK-like protein/glycosyltransferase involved in cell wall biosynthesis
MSTLLVTGTFDVANYGDLLFPRIIEQRFSASFDRFVFASPRGGPPVWNGCPPTVSIAEALAGVESDAVLIGGGNVVHPRRTPLPEYELSDLDSVLAYPSIWLGAALAAERAGVPLAWNAPGVPAAFGPETEAQIRWVARRSSYLSVRDRASADVLSEAGVDPRGVRIVPDTGLDVARLWGADELAEVRERTLGEDASRRYIAVHLNARYVGGAPRELAAVLDRASRSLDAVLVLLALGPCHGDATFAQVVAEELASPHRVVVPSDLRVPPAVIDGGELYLGSSLHGLVTAVAFGRPGRLVARERGDAAKFSGFLDHLGSPEGTISTSWNEACGEIEALAAGSDAVWPGLRAARDELERHWDDLTSAVTADSEERVPVGASMEGPVSTLTPVLPPASALPFFAEALELTSARSADHEAALRRSRSREAELQAANADLARQVEDLRRVAGTSEPRLARAGDALDEVERVLDLVTGSTSWRFARSLAGTADRVRRGGAPGWDAVAAIDRQLQALRDALGLPPRNAPVRGTPAPALDVDTVPETDPVTVIVPIHNAFEATRACVDSLLRHTSDPRAGVLLIDDASTDPRIGEHLRRLATVPRIRVMTNDENLGFVATVNRGIRATTGDVVILNSDTRVVPRWLQNLRSTAYSGDRIGTVTPLSDNAGAFSVPVAGQRNALPEGADEVSLARSIMHSSAIERPRVPTGNGFCMYLRRGMLDEVGLFDEVAFPRGYGEENDLCMRARAGGWEHVVDDRTIVFHSRSASFGTQKADLLRAGRAKVDERHPDYTELVREFGASPSMARIRERAGSAWASPDARPRILSVLHSGRGGTPRTNLDLMHAIQSAFDPYVLTSDGTAIELAHIEGGELRPLWRHPLGRTLTVADLTDPGYRRIVAGLLDRYGIELVHIRHLLGHTLDLPEICARLGIPSIVSFHDYYFVCPTLHLLDEEGRYCGGSCTPSRGDCSIPSQRWSVGVARLKHEWIHTWQSSVLRVLRYSSAYVTTSEVARDIHLNAYPELATAPFPVIEHGRDLPAPPVLVPQRSDRVRILVPGNINTHKGTDAVRRLRQHDAHHGRRLEFHFLGELHEDHRDLGTWHGPYERERFLDEVGRIAPRFVAVLSPWPETYSHTLTEGWAAGLPALVSEGGAPAERVRAHGGGWVLDLSDVPGAYERILAADIDEEGYRAASEQALRNARSRTSAAMADDYLDLYGSVLASHRLGREGEQLSEVVSSQGGLLR